MTRSKAGTRTRPSKRKRVAPTGNGAAGGDIRRRLSKVYALSMATPGDPLEIFSSAARMIADLFGVATVCLSKICGDELRFLSIYENGKIMVDAGSCALAVTPCATVAESKDIRVYNRVAQRFPRASFLRDRKAYSYCGFPVLGSDGSVIAVICLVDPRPRTFRRQDRELLAIFAQRIGVEIERKRFREERERADQQLKKFEVILDQSPCVVLLTNISGVIEYANPKFYSVTGYTPEEVIGHTPAILKSGHTPRAKYEELWACLKAGREWHGEFLNRKKNGQLYWSKESISPIYDADGRMTHFVAIEEDTTERHSLEERLREVQKMDAVGQIAGGIAHDFNNLLMITLGNLELLLADHAVTGSSKVLAEKALKSSLRASDLTQKLLAVSRKQPLRPAVLDARDIVSDLAQMLHATLSERITLDIRVDSDLWPVFADPVQIETALLNLAINARDAMPEGGTLTIEVANATLGPAQIRAFNDVAPGEYVMFAVTDTGSGMPPDVAHRAFEPFYTTKGVGKGTGLGLSVVHGFVHQSGGFADLKSAPGKGTTVRFYLPRMSPENEHADVAENRSARSYQAT